MMENNTDIIVAELMIEIMSEKIPIVNNVYDLVNDAVRLVTSKYDLISKINPRIYISCHRILIIFEGFPSKFRSMSKIIKGPRVSSEKAVVDAFAKKHSLATENLTQKDFKGTSFYCFESHGELESIYEKVGYLIQEIITSIKWPEYMRWSKDFPQWIRPIRRLVATYNSMPLVFQVGDINSSSTSLYVFNEDEDFTFTSSNNYFSNLETRQIFLDHEKRYNFITRQIKAMIENLKLNEDSEKMIEKLINSSESPFMYLASCQDHCGLPKELVKENTIYHQNAIPLFEENGDISTKFLLYSDTKLADDGAKLIRQSGKSLFARLTEASHHWKRDLVPSSEDYLKRLSHSALHSKLGSLAQQTLRLEFAITKFPAYSEDLNIATRFLNFDLTMDTIYETPELHGIISSLYASHKYSANENVTRFIRHSQYPYAEEPLPKGLSQGGATLGFVARLDRLVGFFGIGEIPTGSSDMLGLRRAVFGLLKLGSYIKDCPPLSELINNVLLLYKEQGIALNSNTKEVLTEFILKRLESLLVKIGGQFGHLFLRESVNWQEISRLEFFLPHSNILPNLETASRRLSGLKLPELENIPKPSSREDENLVNLLSTYPVALSKEPSFMNEVSTEVNNLLDKIQVNSLEGEKKEAIVSSLNFAHKILKGYYRNA